MITRLDADGLEDLYWSAKRSVFRVELLQSYDWPDEEHRVAEWQVTGKVSPATDEQWVRLAEQIQSGVPNTLAHVIDLPLTDYLRYEFAAYQADNLPAGQDVRIAVRSRSPELAQVTEEFALLDDVVVWYRYSKETGVKLGWERDDDLAVLAKCQRHHDLVIAHSVPLLEFIDELRDDEK